MAGESAREVARRRREKAERLARAADAWEKGADGEEATAVALAALPAEEWTVFHDIRWPGRRYANIDHVVVGPGGVFVIDSKNWSGRVEVDDNVLRQNGRSREKAVAGVAEAALAITQMTSPVATRHVQPVLCFVRDDALTGWARDVMVCSTRNLTEMVLSRTRALSPEQVRETAFELDAQIRAAAIEEASPYVPGARRPASPAQVAAALPPKVAAQKPGKRRLSAGDWIRFALAMGFLGLLLTRPEVLTSVADWFAGWFTGVVVD